MPDVLTQISHLCTVYLGEICAYDINAMIRVFLGQKDHQMVAVLIIAWLWHPQPSGTQAFFLLRNIWLVCYLRILFATQRLTGVWEFPHGGFLLKKDICCEENSHGSEGAEVLFKCRHEIHKAPVFLFEEITFKDKAQLSWHREGLLW